MKLSEAIREGAKLRPQCFGKLFAVTDHKIQATCAVGAAYEVLQGLPRIDTWGEVLISSQYLLGINEKVGVITKGITHPETGDGHDDLYCVIESLNDNYRWSRERIANWLSEIGY